MNPPSRPASPKSSNIAVHDLSCASDCPCREKVLKEAFHVFADIYWFAIMPDKMIDPESDSLVERTRVLSPVFIILSREDHHILCDLRKAYDDRETPCFFDFAHGKHIEGVIPKVILLMPPIIEKVEEEFTKRAHTFKLWRSFRMLERSRSESALEHTAIVVCGFTWQVIHDSRGIYRPVTRRWMFDFFGISDVNLSVAMLSQLRKDGLKCQNDVNLGLRLVIVLYCGLVCMVSCHKNISSWQHIGRWRQELRDTCNCLSEAHSLLPAWATKEVLDYLKYVEDEENFRKVSCPPKEEGFSKTGNDEWTPVEDELSAEIGLLQA